MLVEDGTLRWEDGVWHLTADPEAIDIPPTISALIAARLDQLAQLERTVVERGAVIGQTFWVGAVAALMPDRARGRDHAVPPDAVGKELVAPDRSTFDGQDAYSFRHILIRDSTYGGLLKRTRAELHERFARWLASFTGDRADEFEEIIGYHLEQSYRNRLDLGPLDDAGRAIAEEASRHLAAAGRRAFTRSDLSGASQPPRAGRGGPRPAAPVRHGAGARPGRRAGLEGRVRPARTPTSSEVLFAAEESGDLRLHTEARIVQMFGRYLTDPENFSDAALGLAEEAIVVFASAGDHVGIVEGLAVDRIRSRAAVPVCEGRGGGSSRSGGGAAVRATGARSW